MKKEFIYLPSNPVAIKSGQKKWFLLSVLLLLSFGQVFSQSIERLDDKLVKDPGESGYLKNLVTNIHPTVTIENGNIKTFGAGSPVVLNFESGDFTVLYSENPLFSEVELIKIKISNTGDLHSRLNLEQMQGFNNLAYIVVLFSYDVCGSGSDNCLATHVQNLVTDPAEFPVQVFYKLSIPN